MAQGTFDAFAITFLALPYLLPTSLESPELKTMMGKTAAGLGEFWSGPTWQWEVRVEMRN
jgi:hypothetical protein